MLIIFFKIKMKFQNDKLENMWEEQHHFMSVCILQISLMSGLIKNKQLPDSQRLPLCLICRGKLVWMKCVSNGGLI